jgi:GWxTD domain-containing protein
MAHDARLLRSDEKEWRLLRRLAPRNDKLIRRHRNDRRMKCHREERSDVAISLYLLFILLLLGLMSCGGTGKISFDPESEKFYETARLIMTGGEKDIFNHLPDQKSREEFIADFWAKRDPDPDTEENEFKQEFYRRIDYANSHFREGTPGWKTDRGRIYIYLGPPDKTEEFVFHEDPTIRGPILWWVYYEFNLGFEFADERGDSQYKLRRYDGEFNYALEKARLGYIGQAGGGRGQKFMNFNLNFDSAKKEIVISIPAKAFSFREEEGLLKADLEFEFYLYKKGTQKKEKFHEAKSVAMTEEEVLETKQIVFTFPHELKPGSYYLDVIIAGKDAISKTRKIFEIKV